MSTSGASIQIFTITQGTTVTTVTLDLAHNTTTVADNAGNSSGALTGLPQNLNNSPATEAAMLYVNGAISGTDSHGNNSTFGPQFRRGDSRWFRCYSDRDGHDRRHGKYIVFP